MLNLSNTGDTIHFTRSFELTSASSGISQLFTATGNTIIMDGRISTGYQGYVDYADGSSVSIGRTGVITAEIAMLFSCDDISVVNRGTINAPYMGIVVNGDGARIRNDGFISANYGISLNDGSAVVVNARNGRIEGYSNGFLSDCDESEKVVVTNHGSVTSGYFAAKGGDEDNTVISDGKMIGDIDLGDGTNLVDLRNGKFRGEIVGGSGDDQLITDNARYQLVEVQAQGYDSVIASVSYTLSDNVEQLTLTGKTAISAIGSAGDNWLFGNAAENTLSGMNGNDKLDGRGGDDRLTGGAGFDIFVFGKAHGKDTIMDFVDDVDRLDLNNWIRTNNFDQIMSHVHDSDRGAVIRFDHQSVTLVDVDKIDLSEGDFLLTI